MNQRQINFNAELIDDEIVIKLTAEDGDRQRAIEAASKLFNSLERIGIEVTRENLEKDWLNES